MRGLEEYNRSGLDRWGFTKLGEWGGEGEKPAYSKLPAPVLQSVMSRLGRAWDEGKNARMPLDLDYYVAGQRNGLTLYFSWTSGVTERSSERALERMWENHAKFWWKDSYSDRGYQAIARHPHATVEMLEKILERGMFTATYEEVHSAIARRGLDVNPDLVAPPGYRVTYLYGERRVGPCADYTG